MSWLFYIVILGPDDLMETGHPFRGIPEKETYCLSEKSWYWSPCKQERKNTYNSAPRCREEYCQKMSKV
jgi:hypothetical protein